MKVQLVVLIVEDSETDAKLMIESIAGRGTWVHLRPPARARRTP
jgi:hypothetical protein